MQFPQGSGKRSAQITTSEFSGLNRSARGKEGAFSKCENLSSDNYPCICTSAGYEDAGLPYSNVQTIISLDGGFCGIAAGVFYHKGTAVAYAPYSHYSIAEDSQINTFMCSGYIYIQETKTNGIQVLYSYDTQNRNVQENNYLTVCNQLYQPTAGGKPILLYYDDSQYNTRDGWYIYIPQEYETEGLFDEKSNLNSAIQSLNTGNEIIICGIDDEDEFMEYRENKTDISSKTIASKCVVITGGTAVEGRTFKSPNGDEIEIGTNQAVKIQFYSLENKEVSPNGGQNSRYIGGIYKHRIPKSTPFEIYKNRAWGGRTDGQAVIASAFGKGSDFFEFQNAASDSVEISSGSDGAFIGCKAYNDSLIAFKKNSMTVIYGDTADNFSTGKEIENIGCIDIRSVQTVDGVLFFCAYDGFYAYSGGQPQFISKNLNARYSKCISFVQEGKYYAEGTDMDGKSEMLVYDARSGIWLAEKPQGIKNIYRGGNEVFILTQNGVKKHHHSYDYEMDSPEWFFESMDLYENVFEKKGIQEIFVRAKLEKGTKMVISTVNSDGSISEHKTFWGNGLISTYRAPIKFQKQDAYRFRISGSGAALIYDAERKLSAGGRNIGE